MIKRLSSSIKWDIILQAKYGLYTAGTIVATMWTLLLFLIPESSLQYAIPMVLFGDLAIIGYIFIAAIMYFEKGQGSIMAVIVTPLRIREYLISKIVSILLYVVGTTLIMVTVLSFARSFSISIAFTMVSAIIISIFFTELGFYLTSKFESFTDFLLPTSFVLMFLTIPIIDFLGFIDGSPIRYILYLWPTYGQLKLLQGCFGNASFIDIIYGLVYNLLCIALLFKVCIKVFNQSMIGRKGDLK